jgi:hypothetical protein
MRLSRVPPLLSLLLGAHAYSLDSREPAPHRLDVRATCDLCATVSTVFGLPGSPRIGGSTLEGSWQSVRLFLNGRQTRASVCRTFPFFLRLMMP